MHSFLIKCTILLKSTITFVKLKFFNFVYLLFYFLVSYLSFILIYHKSYTFIHVGRLAALHGQSIKFWRGAFMRIYGAQNRGGAL